MSLIKLTFDQAKTLIIQAPSGAWKATESGWFLSHPDVKIHVAKDASLWRMERQGNHVGGGRFLPEEAKCLSDLLGIKR